MCPLQAPPARWFRTSRLNRRARCRGSTLYRCARMTRCDTRAANLRLFFVAPRLGAEHGTHSPPPLACAGHSREPAAGAVCRWRALYRARPTSAMNAPYSPSGRALHWRLADKTTPSHAPAASTTTTRVAVGWLGVHRLGTGRATNTPLPRCRRYFRFRPFARRPDAADRYLRRPLNNTGDTVSFTTPGAVAGTGQHYTGCLTRCATCWLPDILSLA